MGKVVYSWYANNKQWNLWKLANGSYSRTVGDEISQECRSRTTNDGLFAFFRISWEEAPNTHCTCRPWTSFWKWTRMWMKEMRCSTAYTRSEYCKFYNTCVVYSSMLDDEFCCWASEFFDLKAKIGQKVQQTWETLGWVCTWMSCRKSQTWNLIVDVFPDEMLL